MSTASGTYPDAAHVSRERSGPSRWLSRSPGRPAGPNRRAPRPRWTDPAPGREQHQRVPGDSGHRHKAGSVNTRDVPGTAVPAYPASALAW